MQSSYENFERHHDLYDALCNAIRNEEVSEVKVLLELGADPNLRHDGLSPLCLATCGHSLPILDMLLLVDAHNNPSEDQEMLDRLTVFDPHIRHLFNKLPQKTRMTVEELFLTHDLYFDMDARRENLERYPVPAPQEPAGQRVYKGKLSNHSGKHSPDKPPDGNSL